MKHLLLTSMAVLITLSVYAQDADRALMRVRYNYIHIKDTTQKKKPHQENMLLVTGRNASVYTSYDKLNRTIKNNNRLMEQFQPGSANPKTGINTEARSPVTASDFFFFFSAHKMFVKERLVNNYVLEEPLEKIDWKIHTDTLTISGIQCQKATAHFKGRNWIAWFSKEMPFQSGPWKLNGLPGLIVEAYDEKKEVIFEFDGITPIKDQQSAKDLNENQQTIQSMGSARVSVETGMEYLGSEIKLPADGIRTSRQELDKLTAARDSDPNGFINAQMASKGIKGTFNGSGNSSLLKTVDSQKKEINNPIELPERK